MRIGIMALVCWWAFSAFAVEPSAGAAKEGGAAVGWSFVLREYCLDCHDSAMEEGGLNLEAHFKTNISSNPETWEKVIRKLRSRQMPPVGKRRPDEASYEAVISHLEATLDRHAERFPNPGRTDTFRRLTRTEYQNAIRDLLGLEVDVRKWLPSDQASHGFDNITVADLSPTLLNRYITAARKISRLAVGSTIREPEGETIRIKPDLTQEKHVEGLPLGTRGGAVFSHTFPRAGEYEIRIRLMRDRNEHVEGLKEAHELDVLLDRRRVRRFTVRPPGKKLRHEDADQHLHARFSVTGGAHEVGVTFAAKPFSLLETRRQPYEAHYNYHRHPRLSPAIYQISITGPHATKKAGDSPSRERIFVRQPEGPEDEDACAREIVSHLMRRAFRRPVTETDLERPLELYREAKVEGGFEAGIEMGVSAVLVSPGFLFRVERDPKDVEPGEVYAVSDLELASRLSFFLWSSIPDEELLEAAIAGRLSEPGVLEAQVRRLLADPKSQALAANFAGQWLHLRNLESITPDLRLFPDFDDNLRQAFREESERLFEHILKKDRSVLELLRVDYTFLNERLAKHYGVPHVYGSRFRRISLDPDHRRGGLLRQGSILTVTSYATRTSPVLRGAWILENILGTPPPPPPPDVPALEDNTVSSNLSMRERLAEHRSNKTCAVCHDLIDPVGFSLERYDAVGRWRKVEDGRPIDASGGLPDGSEFSGVRGLEEALLQRPELFVSVLTEKLMTYALGRGVEHSDAPAVREVVRRAKANDYRFSSIILGIVDSPAFKMRKAL